MQLDQESSISSFYHLESTQIYFHPRGRFGRILLMVKTTHLRGKQHRGKAAGQPQEKLRADPANCKAAGGRKWEEGRIRSAIDL